MLARSLDSRLLTFRTPFGQRASSNLNVRKRRRESHGVLQELALTLTPYRRTLAHIHRRTTRLANRQLRLPYSSPPNRRAGAPRGRPNQSLAEKAKSRIQSIHGCVCSTDVSLSDRALGRRVRPSFGASLGAPSSTPRRVLAPMHSRLLQR